MKKIFLRISFFGIGLIGLAVVLVYLRLNAALPEYEGTIKLSSLQQPVDVAGDNYANPTITANSEHDAFLALGFLTARERMFQMDLMRRKSAGRLAELFGDKALELDIEQRHLQFEHAAKAIIDQLPANQIKVLQAYTDGVNAALEQMQYLPFEFKVLGYQPENWRVEDSILVALGMFQLLSGGENDERMLTIMQQALPDPVTRFLTPDVDAYETVLLGGSDSYRPKQAIPVAELATLLKQSHSNQQSSLDASLLSQLIDTETIDSTVGSNNWAVAGSKTTDGRAIVANDMHLPVSVPGIWYRATLAYEDVLVSGVSIPGLPLIVAGTNRHVAWGYTNAYGDFLDLVKLELNPANPKQYKTINGWVNFTQVTESIQVKDADPHELNVLVSKWGPVSPHKLLNQSVAVHWTALDPHAVDLGLLALNRVKTLEQALLAMNQAKGPPQNAVLADEHGRIAWTLMGSFPKRHGFDGSISRSWQTTERGWDGYIDPQQLPRIIDPAEGYLATANNRTVGKGFPQQFGHNYPGSYRAYRISQALQSMQKITELDMLNLQSDTLSDFYRYYQQLALKALDHANLNNNPGLQDIKHYLEKWDGHANVNSQGIGLLFTFRLALAKTILPAYLESCYRLDNDFQYSWSKMDTPLQQLLNEQAANLLPNKNQYKNWQDLILQTLQISTHQLLNQFQAESLTQINWGSINTSKIQHPFSNSLPYLSPLLDMPQRPLAGCPFCVRVVYGKNGASERFSVSPNHIEQGLMHLPAGQSGHPLSAHYGDQYFYWVNNLPLAFSSTKTSTRLRLTTH